MLQLSYESAQLWSSVAARRAPSEVAVWGGTALLRPALVWSTSCALCALGWQDVFAVSAPARETQSSVFLEREVESSEPRRADIQKVRLPPQVSENGDEGLGPPLHTVKVLIGQGMLLAIG